MNKIKKIILIMFILLLNLLVLSFLQGYPIYISLTNATFFQIPILFWLVLLILPFYLYVIAKTTRNKLILIFCAMFYFFIFYSYGLNFIIHPTTSDISGATLLQEYLTNITHIGAEEISVEGYLQFPIFFVFSKIFSSILGIAPVLTLNLGFMSLITLFPIFLTFFYEKQSNFSNTEKYFIIPALFLTLSYYFLNDQFVPQFLSIIYLIILFGFYKKYREDTNILFFIFIAIFYFLTVFSHSFIFIFFIVALIFEKIWMEYVEKEFIDVISYELIIILFIIPSINISVYIEQLKNVSIFGGSSRIMGYIFSPTNANYQIHPLYNLVPEIYDQFLSNMSKGVVAGAFIIVSIGFLFYFIKKKGIFDLSILIGSFLWFIMGFFRLVLGERALQVAPLALSSHFKQSHKIYSFISKIIIILILISPILTVSNTVINESIGAERLVQDNEQNIAGKFLDKHIINETYNLYILTTQNAYPLSMSFDIRFVGLEYIIFNTTRIQDIDFILDSPKLKLKEMYHNFSFPTNHQDFFVYKSNNVDIISLRNR